MFAISTPSIVPSAVPRASALPGSSVWTWILSAFESPTTSSESPSRSSSASSAVGVEILALDHEDGAVAELGQLLVDGVEAGLVGVLGRRVRKRLAGQRRRDAAHDLEQPGAARVDDARLAQHGELVRRARQRVLAALDQLLQERGGLQLGVARVLGLLGELPDHAQHRPLDRAAHGPVGGVARGAERAADRGGVEQPGLAERLGGAAQDLGEDHARVAARAHQRRARQLLRERGAVGGGRGVEHLHDRARGQRQVRAGVAVRNGIDVQVVDPAAVRLERRERRLPELLRPLELGHADLRDVFDVHLDRGDGQPRQPLDLVRDARAHGRGDLGQVEPVLDDDVQVEPEPVRRAGDLDPLRQLVARQQPLQPLAGHADDAVALGGGVADDLRDRVGRDRDPAQVGLLREVSPLHVPRA